MPQVDFSKVDMDGSEMVGAINIAPLDRIRHYLSLTKPRIVLMVQITTLIGYVLGSRGCIDLIRAVELLFWSSACCGGVGVLNQYIERREDALMRRTRNRVIPMHLIEPDLALIFGLLLTISGCLMLWILINPLCSVISIATVLLYVGVYTPLKKVSWWNTVVGAVPGALPPLGGWVAGSGIVEVGGILLFLLLFCWQHPHFYSIAWIYKDDYEAGGFVMLPSVDVTGHKMFAQIWFFMLLLLLVSLAPLWYATYSNFYLISALWLFYIYMRASVMFLANKTKQNAYKLLRSSIIYLPGILLALLFSIQYP